MIYIIGHIVINSVHAMKDVCIVRNSKIYKRKGQNKARLDPAR